MTSLTINNQKVEVAEGTRLLDAIEKLGMKVPTLCDHKALTPYGACRLCVVEVHVPGRTPTVQASCSYPALEGLEVFTDTDRVKRARKVTAELLLARCPDSELIRRIAAFCVPLRLAGSVVSCVGIPALRRACRCSGTTRSKPPGSASR